VFTVLSGFLCCCAIFSSFFYSQSHREVFCSKVRDGGEPKNAKEQENIKKDAASKASGHVHRVHFLLVAFHEDRSRLLRRKHPLVGEDTFGGRSKNVGCGEGGDLA
jgi:hypothetical protein